MPSKSKKFDVQKIYDVDFNRVTLLAEEPFKVYFQLFIDVVLPYLKSIDKPVNLDADEKQIDRLRALLLQITNETQSKFNLGRLQAEIASSFKNIQSKSTANFKKTLEKQIAVAANKRNLKGAIEASKELVSSISARYATALNDITTRNSKQAGLDLYVNQESATGTSIASRVINGVSAGERWESIAKAILGTDKPKSGSSVVADAPDGSDARKIINKAKFIARNATSTVVGEYDKRQQTDAGIQFYIWRSAQDELVRDTHVQLNGEVFSWGSSIEAPDDITFEGEVVARKGQTIKQASDKNYNGGAPTYPGQPWNCRCVSIALIPGIDYEV